MKLELEVKSDRTEMSIPVIARMCGFAMEKKRKKCTAYRITGITTTQLDALNIKTVLSGSRDVSGRKLTELDTADA